MVLKVDEKKKLEAVKGAGVPQLFMPAGNDHENVKPGGLGEQILGKDQLTIIEFPDMKHGWTTRGDLSDANVERDARKALAEAAKFFEKYVK